MGRNLKDLKRETGRKGTKFIEYVKRYLPYAPSQIYFMISLYELASTYNKLMYVSMSVRLLKTKFKLVREAMENDPDFWTQPPLRS
jgi:hypothetical protein